MPTDRRVPWSDRGAVITVGTFDGVHRGHRDLLDRIGARARETGRASVVVTFEPHPLEVVNPTAAPMLLTPHAEKVEALADSPVDYAVVIPFTPALSHLSARAFVERFLVARFHLRELWIGHDHGLGRGREGSAEALRAIGAEAGFPVHVFDAVTDSHGHPISSTSVRNAIAHGDLGRARDALGRRYAVRGRVVPGASRGRGLGFPTINVAMPSPRKLLPPDGVYAVRAQLAAGTFDGMMNLGGRPTFGDETRTIEAHLFDGEGDWYGAEVRVEFVSRLRDVMRFSGPDALVAQLRNDEENARRALTEV